MARDSCEAHEERPLSSLGISESEERVYRFLLTQSSVTLQDVADVLDLPTRASQRVLDALEIKGLVSHSPERPRRYIPIPPDLAMKSMLLKRQQELQRTRVAIDELQAQATVLRDTDSLHMVELIAPEAERHIFQQLMLTAEFEVLGLIRSPLRISNLADPADHDPQRQSRARGVVFRSIADNEVLALPGVATAILADMESGEQVRVFPTLPFKMIIADRRTALVPLRPGRPGARILLVRESALLDALCALFEVLWERAAPISATPHDGDASRPPFSLSNECASLVPLLAAGLTDQVIADELNVSTRTFDRRVFKLLKELDARTRFQAGWNAAVRSQGEITPPKKISRRST